MTLGHPALNLLLFRKKAVPEQGFAMLGVLLPDVFHWAVMFFAVILLGFPGPNNRIHFFGQSLHSFFIWLIVVEIFYVAKLWRNRKIKYFCLGWFLHILEDVISHKGTGRGSALEFQKYLFPFPVKLDGFFNHDRWPFNVIEILASLAIFIIFRRAFWEILKYSAGAIRLRKN